MMEKYSLMNFEPMASNLTLFHMFFCKMIIIYPTIYRQVVPATYSISPVQPQ